MKSALDSGAATPADTRAGRQSRVYSSARRFLGGSRVIRRRLSDSPDVHATIVNGLPYAALFALMATLKTLPVVDVIRVLGASARALRRRRDTSNEAMPISLASKTWLLAETLAKASAVLGSQQKAEDWMSKPAMGLDGYRPIDLLQTIQGAEIVDEFLVRLEYCVYS